MGKVFAAAMLAVLAGCTAFGFHPTTTTDTVWKDGRAAKVVNCDSLDKCYVAAGEACPAGYNEVERPKTGTVINHTLVIQCKKGTAQR